ncbi:phage major tail tube protein [Azospirillum cavernae]|uniref:Phage major tail tube protein n=1 Tax=Azospirillum cavernae TaxID=2320860 RepID=A0A418VVH0_9PROT|nr:phage major tail tube protein [Azospirillum cavernae]RJF81134.1 phage major tail tube protein [Azospirillum cavernae]
MPIQFPRVLKNMNLFIDGRGYAGRVDELTLPKLTLQTEDHRAGGMDAPVDLELGMEKLEAAMTVSDFDPDIFKSFGLLDSAALPVTVRGAFQAQGGTVQAVTVNLRGGWKEIDLGTWKPGDKSALSLAFTGFYYKLTVDGGDLIEIDVINMKRVIDGKDQLEAQRTAIGL